jgi:hypothetical protein
VRGIGTLIICAHLLMKGVSLGVDIGPSQFKPPQN